MFFVLHRVAQGIFALIVCAILYWLYTQRHVAQPAVDYFELWWASRHLERNFLGQLSGKVNHVVNGDTFELRGGDGFTYRFRLAGLEAPQTDMVRDREIRELFGLSKTNLENLILSKQVTVDFTFLSEQRGGVGVVHLTTNLVNAEVLAAGMGWINKAGLMTLPLRLQYDMLIAERVARQQQRGIWKLAGTGQLGSR